MTVHAPRLIELPYARDDRGTLTYAEENEHVPFRIARAYWVTGVPLDGRRGGHAHRALHQVVIAVGGECSFRLHNGIREQTFRLRDPQTGLYVPPMWWGELQSLTPGFACLVLASDRYRDSDYIRDFGAFQSLSAAS